MLHNNSNNNNNNNNNLKLYNITFNSREASEQSLLRNIFFTHAYFSGRF